MSKYTVTGGDLAGLFERFSLLQEKARERTGRSFRIIVIQEAGLDGFWIHRALENEGIEELRALLRTRKQLSNEQTRHIQRIQKTLEALCSAWTAPSRAPIFSPILSDF